MSSNTKPCLQLRKIWASGIVSNICESHSSGDIIELCNDGLDLFQEVLSKGWSTGLCEIDLGKKTITVR